MTKKQNKKDKKGQKHKATYKMANVVVNVFLKKQLPLKSIADRFRDVQFNLNKFPGIHIKMKQPKCAVLLFKNGKMVITGLKRTKDIKNVVEKVTNKLNQIGIEVPKNPERKIVNLVISLDFGININLDHAIIYLESSVYEPEVFPGIIFRMYDPVKAVFLIFSSGKAVLTGIQDEKVIPQAIKELGIMLKKNDLLIGF